MIAMTSLISTIPCLSSPAVYPSWAISVHSSTVFSHSLTISAQSSTTCANVTATRDFVASSSVVCMARCDNKFVLPASPIAENLQRCDRALCTTCKGKEAPYGRSYNDEWFLDSGASAHFTPFESDFVSMTQGNYGRVETANSKAPLFMVAVGTVLIEHEIIDLKDRTTRTAISKLWLVYYNPVDHLLLTDVSSTSNLRLCDLIYY